MNYGKFTDRIGTADVAKMPSEYRELLIRLLTIQADCEIGGPRVYGPQWFLDAPTADDMFRLTHIMAEEVDHFRAFSGLLKDLGTDRSDLLRHTQSERFLEPFRVTHLPFWADVAAFCLIDRVGQLQLEEMVESSYLPFDRVLPKVLLEEVGHIGFGTARLTELAINPWTKGQAQNAVDRWYPCALDMFGRSDSRRAERYVEWGLKRRLNDEARRDYITRVGPVLEGMGLTVPDETSRRRYL